MSRLGFGDRGRCGCFARQLSKLLLTPSTRAVLVVFNSSRLIGFDPNGIRQDTCAGSVALSVPVHEEVKTYCA